MQSKSAVLALLPIAAFLSLFIGSGIYFTILGEDYAFYKISPAVAIIPGILLAMCLGKDGLKKNIENFIEGVRDRNIITMCVIYLLAGAYSALSKGIGGVDATVFMALDFVPIEYSAPGIFIVAALLSTAMGTSMGTIAAFGPIAVGIANSVGLDMSLVMGAVVGGAMFGDNLSMISDTTIAATQVHPCSLKEKFILNGWIALPAMIITIILLLSMGNVNLGYDYAHVDYNPWLGVPYLIVLGLALAGINVFTVLMLGIITSTLMGVFMVDGIGWAKVSSLIFTGYSDTSEILILSLLIGGLSHLAKEQGGIVFLINLTDKMVEKFASKRRDSRVALGAISAIASFCDICTANNTVAIVLSGEATQAIAKKHHVSNLKTAAFVDIFSCVFQGILPYSAQILLAGSIASLSPLSIIGNVHYCFALGGASIIFILLKLPRTKNHP